MGGPKFSSILRIRKLLEKIKGKKWMASKRYITTLAAKENWMLGVVLVHVHFCTLCFTVQKPKLKGSWNLLFEAAKKFFGVEPWEKCALFGNQGCWRFLACDCLPSSFILDLKLPYCNLIIHDFFSLCCLNSIYFGFYSSRLIPCRSV